MRSCCRIVVLMLLATACCLGADGGSPPASAPADVFAGELVSFPGAWGFQLGKSAIILVSDEQFRALEDPDRKVNLSLGATPHEQSLCQVCEQAKAAGHRTLVLAFDHFFAQYRPGQGDKPRELMPDSDEYIRRIAAISRFANDYGLGLELSLLSPLEIGPAYARQTGESGVWMHYRKGVRDPKSGRYSVQLWRQRKWANNKGPIDLIDSGVRVFAFRERRLHGSPYIVVDPRNVVEISDTARVEVWDDARGRQGCVRVRIHGDGGPEGYDRVLVVQMYRTPEMDYFSDRALPYLTGLLDRYVDAGVQLNALYSDEIHIQQDWAYHDHHDHGAFAVRFVSPGFAKRFADTYGAEYADFAKYLVYFTHGQEDTATDLTARGDFQHVLGDSPEAIAATGLLRARYYELLQDGVTGLFVQAKRHLESRLGKRLEARAHATWAQSPTCDGWDPGRTPLGPQGYEYTPSFLWSNTVHQAAAACADYFRWGDFLTGGGNDHTEGGYLDRNYYGLALACSTGILNEVPNSYAAHWGMPAEVSQRRQYLVNAYGDSGWPPHSMVQETQHRDVSVLMLYPINLVAANERFGSWMTQYGYANYLTPAKLLERGRVVGGAIEMAGRRFTTLVTLFEPYPPKELLQMMRALTDGGGCVIWSGPPPVLSWDGGAALASWQDLVGVEFPPARNDGYTAGGRQVTFESTLGKLPAMPILTDLFVDHVYPVSPREGAQIVGRTGRHILGTVRRTPAGGNVTFLGFRPRDDQAASLGQEARWWFEILHALGAYPPTRKSEAGNDNTEYLSRTTGLLCCRFPNDTISIAPHLRDLEESWPGGFSRNAEQDAAIVKNLALPSEQVRLNDFRVNGRVVSYDGTGTVSFRADTDGILVAFAGSNCKQITVDGRTTVFADAPMGLVSFAPVEATRRVPGGAVMQMLVYGSGTVRIPLRGVTGPVELVLQGRQLGSRGRVVPSKIEDRTLVFESSPATHNWMFVVPRGEKTATRPRD